MGSGELGQLLENHEEIYIFKKEEERREKARAGGVVVTHWDARRSEEMGLGRQQASHQYFGSGVGAPSAAEHLVTFSLPELSQRGSSSAVL